VTYRSAVLADAPNAYWPMEETSGDIVDVIAGVRATQAVGLNHDPATLGTRSGPISNKTARDFPGVTEHFVVPVANVGGFAWRGGNYSAEWWSIADSLGQDAIFSFRTNASTNDQGVSVFAGASGIGLINIDMGPSGTRSAAGDMLTTNAWQHYALTYDSPSNTRRMYLNGVLEWTGAQPTTLPAQDAALTIGMLGGNASYIWDGGLAHLALYRKTLSAAQVKAHWDAAVGEGTPAVIGGGQPKVQIGAEWTKKPAKVYLNGQWVEKPMKRHNGTEWVVI
jgi:hypothetical protein